MIKNYTTRDEYQSLFCLSRFSDPIGNYNRSSLVIDC